MHRLGEQRAQEAVAAQRRQLLPLDRIRASHLDAFSRVIGAKLRDPSSGFARSYLRAVVDRVVVTGDTAEITGSRARLVAAIAGESPGADLVPGFLQSWRARRDSNSRPPGS